MSGHGKIQTIPTTKVTGYWDAGSVSEFPEEIKVVMANGKRVFYRIQVEQPRPHVMKPHEMALIFRDHVYGGGNYEK